MSSPLAGVAAINAITFGVYGNVLRRLEDPASVSSVVTAGAAAGLIQVGSKQDNNKLCVENIKF
jgi:solute carrier family 25 carnitine/acylcarnitine transporter 20/29